VGGEGKDTASEATVVAMKLQRELHERSSIIATPREQMSKSPSVDGMRQRQEGARKEKRKKRKMENN